MIRKFKGEFRVSWDYNGLQRKSVFQNLEFFLARFSPHAAGLLTASGDSR